MQKKIRILAIAPYEGLKALMQKVCETEFPQIELTIPVGDWKDGLDAAHANFHKGFDAIISRGGTALLLRERIDLPVIDIPLTAFDILRAQQLADGLSDRYAIVGFPNMAQNATVLNEILKLNLDIYSYDMPVDTREAPEELYALLEDLRAKGYYSILGDNSAVAAAKQMGLSAVMLSSGVESIREAFTNAIRLCSSTEALRNENHFLRELLQEQASETIVFDQRQALYFSTFNLYGEEAVEEMFRAEIPMVSPDNTRRFQKSINGTLYTVKARSFCIGSAVYTAFYFTTRKIATPEQTGIRYCSLQDLQSMVQDSFYGVIKNTVGLQKAEALPNFSNAPILLTGEYGMEIDFAAISICLNSSLKNRPFVHIDCTLLNNRSWNYLLNHHNSPINLTNRTIYFQNVDSLAAEQLRQLISNCVSTNLHRRNQLIFSCTCPYGTSNSATGYEILEMLSAQLVNLPPLRELRDYFPQLVNLCLIQLNSNLPVEIYGTETDAINLLQTYDWPHNFKQFRRIISSLAVAAKDQLIRIDAVRTLLQEEQHNSYTMIPSLQLPLNTSKTLEEITQEVIQFVLKETNGNQTLAAKRLGIGRTTLWRLLKNG